MFQRSVWYEAIYHQFSRCIKMHIGAIFAAFAWTMYSARWVENVLHNVYFLKMMDIHVIMPI